MIRRIYTLGHGARDFGGFEKLLQKFGVKALVDIRRWPTSKTIWFNRENLEKKLSRMGIHYVWMGDTLGGYRPGGYPDYIKTEEFRLGFWKLVELASHRKCAIMCLEISPKGCHRRFISQLLADDSWTVLHIFSEGRLEQHQTLFSEQVRQ